MNALSKLRNTHPDHHAIAKGMISVALFVFIGKLAGASKEMAIAYRYGVSEAVDAYLLVFTLITWPVGVWFSVLTVVLVPLAARMRQDKAIDIAKFRAELLAFSLLLGLILALAAGLGLPALLNSSWLGLSNATRTVALNVTPSSLVLAPLGVLISLFSAWLLSAGRHVNTLLESVPALAILIAVLLLPNQGIEALVWGTVAGLFLHLISLAIPLAWRSEIEKPCFTQHSPQWSAFWQGFGIMLAGQILMSFTTLIDQFFAAHLDTGAIATLSYANRILALILGLGATAVSRATLPIFSKIQADDGGKLHKMAMRWAGILFVMGLVAMLMSWWLAPWGVKLLFERGAFTAQNTVAVTEVFRYSLVQLPFYFSGLVLVSLLASRRHHKFIAIGAGINLFVKIGANYLFIPLMGIKGIVTATAIMYMASFITLYWFCTIQSSKSIKTT
jgi:peptidoglycan biosynthesis protein MviN/MurJ (putative lipid II flippase)